MTSRRPPHAILFDLDDTFWPIAPVISAAETSWHAWLADHAPGVAGRFSIDELRRRRLALLEQRPELVIDLGTLRRIGLEAAFALTGEDSAHIDGAMAHFHTARNAVTLFDDVLPVLLELQPRVRLGVITNGNADLEVIGLHHHFQVMLASATFGSAKPDPAIFLAACAALEVAPADAIYVGDDLRLDVQGAQNAGLRAVWIDRGLRPEHDRALLDGGIVPDAICDSFGALRDWLLQQWEE